MPATNSFFEWFFYGLGGLGGWFIFALLALAAVIWLIYDSINRRLPVLIWQMGIVIMAALVLPALLYRFMITSVDDLVSSPLAPFSEIIFYLGLAGGILPGVLSIGYYVTYKGLAGCPAGHIYEKSMGKCPHPDHLPQQPQIVYKPTGKAKEFEHPHEEIVVDSRPPKHHVQAWLLAKNGRSYQLFEGETTIGRSTKNDITLGGDSTIGREHARITEQNNHFRLNDLGSKNLTRVNNHIVREPVLLEPDDEIQFGDKTILRFMTPR